MKSFLAILLITLPLLICAQQHWCNVDQRFDLTRKNNSYDRFNTLVQVQEDFGAIQNRSIRYFPVVVHVVAPDGFQQISEAQVLHQLDVLNDDFAGEGENIEKLREEFIPLISDAEFRFCLAKTDPSGQPTTGITFTQTSVRDIALQTGEEGRIAIHWDQLGGKAGWDPTRYINIWVGEYGSVLGSASFPGMASFDEEIGLIMDLHHFGSIGDAGLSGLYGRGHTLTHEMGHFFGLKHIWGEGEDTDCDDTDDIDDTPNAAGPYFGCPSGNKVSCFQNNMYQNFMDLTDDRCLAAFTQGQVNRMQAAIEIYYPNLPTEGSCATVATTFPIWYDQLTWSHDASSNKYVIYNRDNWEGIKKIKVCSMDGKLIFEDTWDDQLTYLLDLNRAAAGVYLARISDGSRYEVRKIAVFK